MAAVQFVLSTLLIITLLLLDNGDAALVCAFCRDVSDPIHSTQCNKTQEICSDNEECFTGKYLNQEGAVLYQLGCKPTKYCDVLRRLLIGKRQLHHGDAIMTCQMCCSASNKCNKQLCQ